MRTRDDLILFVQKLHKQLKQAATSQKVSLDGNIILKFARYYNRRCDCNQPLEQLFSLMKLKPEQRGSGFEKNWQLIGKNLENNKAVFNKLSPKDIAYVLGWLAKLSRVDGA